MAHHPHHHHESVSLGDEPDAWHIHTVDEGTPQEEHGSSYSAPILLGAFIATCLFVGGTVIVLIIYFQAHTTRLRQARIETVAVAREYREYRQQAEEKLYGYGWATPEAAAAGQVSIPVERAKAKVLQQYGSQEPRGSR